MPQGFAFVPGFVVFALVVCLAVAGLTDRAAAADDGLEVELMTFNIRYGSASDGDNHWRHRQLLVCDVVNESGGDFVGLQEAELFQIERIRQAVPRYATVGVGREDGEAAGEFSNILYDQQRWRLDEQHHGTFWLSDTPDEPGSTSWGNRITRICTWARFIEHDTGRAIYVFNTHFDHQSQPSRERSAELVAERIADRPHPDEPVVLMGDLNAGENNPAIRYLKGETGDAPVRLVDTFRVVHPDADPVGTATAFQIGLTGGSKIDYVLAEPDADVRDAAILRTQRDGRYPSDHFPVTATLRWGE